MGRIKIEIPETHVYSTQLSMRISEINYGGHLGNDSALGLCHEVRLQFLKSRGFSEMNFAGLGLIMSDAALVYKAEAFHGETLQADLYIADLHRCGFDLIYLFQKEAKEVLRAKTGLVFFDYNRRQITHAPANLESLLAAGL